MRYLHLLLLLSGLFIFSHGIYANTVKTVTVSASGNTETAAIGHALSQAVQQLNGVDVRVVTQLEETEPKLLIDWLGNKVVLEGGSINTGFTRIEGGGPISSYRVLDSALENSGWRVTIQAEVIRYKALGEDRSQMPSLAISLHAGKSHFDTLDGQQAAQAVLDELDQVLQNQLVQSARFRVLDRSNRADIAREQAIIREQGQATQQAVQLGQQLGADWILSGTVRNLEISKQPQKIYDSYNDLYHGEFLIDMQVIETATGEIRWSDSFTQRFTHQQLRSQIRELRNEQREKTLDQAEKELREALYRHFCTDISRSMVSHFFPPRILQSDAPNTVYLSQGSGLIKEGDSYLFKAPGMTLSDPDNNLPIEIAGSTQALVVITEVHDYYAVARLAEGSLQGIEPGTIAHWQPPQAEQKTPNRPPERPLTPGSSEEPLIWP